MAEQPASPCIGVCELDRQLGICLGCLRTRDEIAGWSRFDEPRRQQVRDRLAALKARKRGATGSSAPREE
ncbi:MAG: DUF1289 domain-containing protein [Calditrichaeota bacterium]|nr:DUF1289 domain-containing protein [Candidatus Cloacimonadota bacterium]MCA9787620.1 DUF1289 domain-containing protein [Candidatus Cloacimonadota bacterium]MCB1046089.1 DUF1289 domain-containing protein [Calditrichota bacterium]MCB9472625.1 DUF1289 domain-containing protein [Candidatus Delongbacteria bacterium]